MERRVVIIGKNRLAVECLDHVLDAGDRVVLAVADPGDDGSDGWQPSFRAAAERRGLPVVVPADVNEGAFVDRVSSEAPDFLLSFQAAQILRPPLIATPAIAALNLHFGPLPRYRGVAPIAWALINGEPATGVTIHHINPGVDTGELVRAKEVPIEPDDTGRTLYDKCTAAGIDLFGESWTDLRAGDIEAIPQDSGEALYYNRHSIDYGRRVVSWHADAKTIGNWIRAFIFPPFQYPVIVLDGDEYEITETSWDRRSHRARPGEILTTDGAVIVVAAPGGRITLGHLRKGGVVLSAEETASAGLLPGAVLNGP